MFLAPLEAVIAQGRARALFGFDCVWEVYKPASKRRWGYYTFPILYGDRLVARLDPELERASARLIVKGFWLENVETGRRLEFAQALARGLSRLARAVGAEGIDVPAVGPAGLRRRFQVGLREYSG